MHNVSRARSSLPHPAVRAEVEGEKTLSSLEGRLCDKCNVRIVVVHREPPRDARMLPGEGRSLPSKGGAAGGTTRTDYAVGPNPWPHRQHAGKGEMIGQCSSKPRSLHLRWDAFALRLDIRGDRRCLGNV